MRIFEGICKDDVQKAAVIIHPRVRSKLRTSIREEHPLNVWSKIGRDPLQGPVRECSRPKVTEKILRLVESCGQASGKVEFIGIIVGPVGCDRCKPATRALWALHTLAHYVSSGNSASTQQWFTKIRM
jgi:hypothetical protein